MRTKVGERWLPEAADPTKDLECPLCSSQGSGDLESGAPRGCVPGPFPEPHTQAGAARLLLLLKGLQQLPTPLPDPEPGLPGRKPAGRAW